MWTPEYQNYTINPSCTNCGSDLIFITVCIFINEDKTTGLCMGWNIPWKILKSDTSSGDTRGLVAPEEEDKDPLIKLGHIKHCVWNGYLFCVHQPHTHGVLKPGCNPSGGSGGCQMMDSAGHSAPAFFPCPVTAGIVLHTQNCCFCSQTCLHWKYRSALWWKTEQLKLRCH